MRYLININHPAQYHLFKHVIVYLKEQNHTVLIIARNKDVLIQLLHNDGVEFINTTHRTDRESNIFSLFVNFILQYHRVKKQTKKFKPDLMLGTSFILPWISKKMKVPYLNFLEDDFRVVPLYSKLSFPFSTHILTPDICQVGKWSNKKIGYNGYHELAFLHPSVFSPLKEIAEKYIDLNKKNFLIRFTAFNAHHDYGKHGIDNKTAKKLINTLQKHGNVLISSEKPLNPELEHLRLTINPNDIHHIIGHCQIIIGDSQSMAMEASCLGIPSLRMNDYAGRISVLEELENTYKLTHSFGIKDVNAFFDKVHYLLITNDIAKTYSLRKEKMIADKIRVDEFLKWFISEYPHSISESKDPNSIKSKFGGKLQEKGSYDLKKGKSQIYIVLFAFYIIALIILYVIPMEGELNLNKHRFLSLRLDYLVHIFLFIPTVFVMAPIFLRQTVFRSINILLLSLIAGALFEVIHYFISYRAFTLEDLLANLVGVTLGAIIYFSYNIKK